LLGAGSILYRAGNNCLYEDIERLCELRMENGGKRKIGWEQQRKIWQGNKMKLEKWIP